MALDVELFQAIQTALPIVFANDTEPLKMQAARPRIISALQGRGFDPVDLRREVYRHIHQSSINVRNARRAYEGVKKVLWNDEKNRTFRLLSQSELQEIASGRIPKEIAFGDASQKLTKNEQIIAKEHVLRDYLAQRLEHLEMGLVLWKSDPPSKEYSLETRFVDIFAKDSTGCPVIVELKLHRAYDRVIGQALLYRALVRIYHSVDRVRIVLIAEKISKELVLATQELADVELFEYHEQACDVEGPPAIKLVRKSKPSQTSEQK